MIDQKQLQSAEFGSCFGSLITDDAKCAREIECRIAREKERSKTSRIFTSKFGLHLKNKLIKYYIGSAAL
jgi:hypothetical protein